MIILKSNTVLALFSSVAVFIASLAISPNAVAGSNFERLQLLAKARAATAKYHNPRNAIADGYYPTNVCVPQMGYHFVKRSLVDSTLRETQPEVLLYADSPRGLKLVGVEYLAPALTLDYQPWFGDLPPSDGFRGVTPLFSGKSLDGPMPGHDADMPWHYDLHVWVWEHNPNGMFAVFNPRVVCRN